MQRVGLHHKDYGSLPRWFSNTWSSSFMLQTGIFFGTCQYKMCVFFNIHFCQIMMFQFDLFGVSLSKKHCPFLRSIYLVDYITWTRWPAVFLKRHKFWWHKKWICFFYAYPLLDFSILCHEYRQASTLISYQRGSLWWPIWKYQMGHLDYSNRTRHNVL